MPVLGLVGALFDGSERADVTGLPERLLQLCARLGVLGLGEQVSLARRPAACADDYLRLLCSPRHLDTGPAECLDGRRRRREGRPFGWPRWMLGAPRLSGKQGGHEHNREPALGECRHSVLGDREPWILDGSDQARTVARKLRPRPGVVKDRGALRGEGQEHDARQHYEGAGGALADFLLFVEERGRRCPGPRGSRPPRRRMTPRV